MKLCRYVNNSSYDWVVESKASLPRAGSAGGQRFWDDLFKGMAAVGLDTYDSCIVLILKS